MSAGTPRSADTSIALLEGIGKRYVKYEDSPTLISGVMRLGSRTRRGRLWAVRNVDLEVGHGETIGVIGRNGSGKTSLLRMLAGVTAPTEGRIAVRGRVAPLISVGVGFDRELTGRENVYVNGTVLGMGRREIEHLFDGIVEFSEIGDFIDTPVKFYSSGMFVRLGFSVAVAARPDMFLVDEVLAVGDIGFQRKCFDRMAEMREQGTALVVVSHNLAAVRNLCERTLVLDGGTPRFFGPTDEAISVYHEVLQHSAPEKQDAGGAPIQVLGVDVLGPDRRETAHLQTDSEATFRIRARALRDVPDPKFAIQLTNQAGQLLYADWSHAAGSTRPLRAGEDVTCHARMRLPLATGTFGVLWWIRWGEDRDEVVGGGPKNFYVSGRNLVHGMVDLDATFELSDGPDPSGSPT